MQKELPVVPLFCSKNFLNDLESVQFVSTILIIDSSVWKFISIFLCRKKVFEPYVIKIWLECKRWVENKYEFVKTETWQIFLNVSHI